MNKIYPSSRYGDDDDNMHVLSAFELLIIIIAIFVLFAALNKILDHEK